MSENRSTEYNKVTDGKCNDDETVEYYFYDSRFVSKDFGLMNSGAICWWNSLIQVMIRLPAFVKIVLSLKPEIYEKSIAANTFIRLIEEFVPNDGSQLTDPAKYSAVSNILLLSIANESKRQNKKIQLNGQQSPAWGLHDFLELLGSDDILRVFNNQYEGIIICPECKTRTSSNIDKNIFIDFYSAKPIETKEDFEKYITYHLTTMDRYTCENCKKESSDIYRLMQLQMLREVVVIYFRPSNKRNWFPKTLDFLSNDGKMLRYALVGQIEHSGNWNLKNGGSGHYWARARTSNSTWKTFNDMSVSISGDGPTGNDHMVFYHLMEHSPCTEEESIKIAARRAARKNKQSE